jgi:RecA-family ATPase
VLAESIAMVSGRNLLGHRPKMKCRVWYINGEDPRDEIDRRIHGILLRYDISREEIEGRLFIDSGRDRDFTLVATTRNGVEVREALCEAIEAEIKAKGIDLLIIDPLISALRIAENDNNVAAPAREEDVGGRGVPLDTNASLSSDPARLPPALAVERA